MFRFITLLAIAASAFGIEYTVSQDVTATTAVVTIQAPATGGKIVAIKSINVGCATAVCTVTIERDGAAAVALDPPGALTAGTPTSGGACTAGTHSYKVTFTSAGGETTAGTASGVITCVTTTGQTVPLSAIPTGPTGTTSRKLYRTVAGDAGSYLLLATLSNNTTTTYSDTTADASLGAAAPAANTTSIEVTPVKLLASAPASTVKAFTRSDVGTGSVLYRLVGRAGGESLWRDMTGTYIFDSGTAKNFTVRVAGTSQQILITIKVDEY